MKIVKLSEEEKKENKIHKLGSICLKYGISEYELKQIYINKISREDKSWTD